MYLSGNEVGVKKFGVERNVVKSGYGVCAKIQNGKWRDGGAGLLQGVRAGGTDGTDWVGAQREGN